MTVSTPELIVNTNTYVTLEEADEYVATHYLSSSTEYKAWFDDTRPQSDRVVALIASAKALNNLRYKGRKAVAGQPLAFPRVLHIFPGVMYLPYTSQYFDSSLYEGVNTSDGGLSSAKEAQIVNAVAHLALNPDIITEVSDRTVKGILGRRSSSFSENYSPTNERSSNLLKGIYNQDKVFYILNAWLTDSIYSL